MTHSPASDASRPPETNQSDEDQAHLDFADSVRNGLSAADKYLSSRYFYDHHGDELFRSIMASPEYYLTNAELEIFEEQAAQIVDVLPVGADIVELGAGDGSKTRLLLAEMLTRGAFCYIPVDISPNSLKGLKQRMARWVPTLDIQPIAGEYFDALARLPEHNGFRVFLFLGSNIGNFAPPAAARFLAKIRSFMSKDDLLMIGVDLKKDPDIILAAYNDAAGHTRAFNLNLLRRINRELGGNFDLTAFEHRPNYDPDSGASKSFLVSKKQQRVKIDAINQTFEFAAGEPVYMEISQKYSPAGLKRLARESGFEVMTSFSDSRNYFADQIWAPTK